LRKLRRNDEPVPEKRPPNHHLKGNKRGNKSTKINPEMALFILEKAPLHSCRQLAEMITEKFGIKISHAGVNSFIRNRQLERKEVTKSVVAEYIAKTVPRDLEILEAMREQLEALRLSKKLSHQELMQTIDRQRHVIDTRLKYAGAGEQAEGHPGKLEEWMKQLI